MCAAQALEFRRPLKASREVERAHSAVRALAPRLDQDRSLAAEIETVAAAIRKGVFDAWCA
jgi:histidine ammonia-lyase